MNDAVTPAEPAGETTNPPPEPSESRLRLVVERSAIVAGIAGLAIAQPVLALFGDNPEFFVSGGYSRQKSLVFGVLVTLVPLLVGIAAVAVGEALGRRVGSIVFRIVVAAYAFVFGMYLVRQLGPEATVPVVAGGLVVAVAVILGHSRLRPVRLFLTYLAFANVLYLGLFVLGSRTGAYIASGADPDVGAISVADTDSPVILLVLDEFPLATIVRPDGTINETRYPNLARLAEQSTWFRNASARQALTPKAVPELLTGRVQKSGSLPTYSDHPRNFYTMFAGSLPVYGIEVATDLCPPRQCSPIEGPLRQAIEDAAIVFGHKLLPATLTNDLPPIDAGFGGFIATANDPAEREIAGGSGSSAVADGPADAYEIWRSVPIGERIGNGQRVAFRSIIETITPEPAAHLLHIALPHSPWGLTPYGERRNFVLPDPDGPGDPTSRVRVRTGYQMHSMQAGATDALVGELIDHLESIEAFDDTLLVVTSDHGASFTAPDLGRSVSPVAREDTLRVPLIVKAPGQTTGVIDDSVAQTVDVLPTIADLMGVDLDWEFDGHSLVDGSEPTLGRALSESVQPLFDLAAARSTWVGDDGWLGLVAVDDLGEYVGRDVSDLVIGADDPRTIVFDDRDRFASLPIESTKFPYVLIGSVQGDRPDELLVVVNDEVAGVLAGFFETDQGWYFYGTTTDAWVDGANDVYALSVDADGVAHRLSDG